MEHLRSVLPAAPSRASSQNGAMDTDHEPVRSNGPLPSFQTASRSVGQLQDCQNGTNAMRPALLWGPPSKSCGPCQMHIASLAPRRISQLRF